MGKVSPYLRNCDYGYMHWCPGCKEMHPLPNTWQFNGDVNKPTFSPSFLHQGLRRVFEDGSWNGEWELDASGNPLPFVCHYFLTDGVLIFLGDSTHNLKGQSVSLPELP